ncbi:MAG: hypothetical protein ACM3UZ_07840 [Acidobacteriota bacterium]
MKRKTIIWVLTLMITVLCFIANCPALAKPMPTPTLENACKSKVILIVSYKSRDICLFPDYFTGINANYQVLRVVKGKYSSKTIKINYAFQDGSPCLEPKGWQFTRNMMPKENSKWIIFIDSASEGVYHTYRGSFGRIEMTDKNLKLVNSILKHNNITRTSI